MTSRLLVYSVSIGRGNGSDRQFARQFRVSTSSPDTVPWAIAELLASLGCDVAAWDGYAIPDKGLCEPIRFDGADMAQRLAKVDAIMAAAK